MNAPLIHLLKEFVIIAIVNVNSNKHRPRCVERLLQYGADLVRRLNHESVRSEGILHWIDAAKLYAGGSTVLLPFLSSDHVICPVNPDHVYEIRLESHRCFKLHCGKEKTSIA